MQGRDDILAILIERGANPNIGNNRSTTPLHKAVQRGELKCVQVLVKAGAKINAQDEDLVTPLHRGIGELAETKDNASKTANIKKAIAELIQHKPKLNLSDKEGLYPLDLAAKVGESELIDAFIGAGADIKHTSHNGYTPLHWAAAGNFVEIISKLIQRGADINGNFSN